MFFIHDKKKKIIYGWSAKSGCSHLKKLLKFLIFNKVNVVQVHSNAEYGAFPVEYNEAYRIILIVRNPYERLISGFLDKYTKPGPYLNRWKGPLTFRLFVQELFHHAFRTIDKHHFTPQLSEEWRDEIRTCKNVQVYDLKNIDYAYLETLYAKKIPNDILAFRGGHENSKPYKRDPRAADTDPRLFTDVRPFWQDFYVDADIQLKVDTFYAADFAYFQSLGLYTAALG